MPGRGQPLLLKRSSRSPTNLVRRINWPVLTDPTISLIDCKHETDKRVSIQSIKGSQCVLYYGGCRLSTVYRLWVVLPGRLRRISPYQELRVFEQPGRPHALFLGGDAVALEIRSSERMAGGGSRSCRRGGIRSLCLAKCFEPFVAKCKPSAHRSLPDWLCPSLEVSFPYRRSGWLEVACPLYAFDAGLLCHELCLSAGESGWVPDTDENRN